MQEAPMTTAHSRRATRRRSGDTTPPKAPKPVVYPESDGKPMSDTGLNVREIVRMGETLRRRFEARDDVCIEMDMFVYYEEGNPRASISPDIFVVFGVPKEPIRTIYKVWEEGKAPDVTFELTSPKTRRVDMDKKRDIYERIGVREYFMYDPLAAYLKPALQGLRLVHGRYQPIVPGADGALMSEALGLHLQLVEGRLYFFDPATGERLLSIQEQHAVEEEARRQAEARAAAEEEARRKAEARAAAAEARLAALLREREQQGGGGPASGRATMGAAGAGGGIHA